PRPGSRSGSSPQPPVRTAGGPAWSPRRAMRHHSGACKPLATPPPAPLSIIRLSDNRRHCARSTAEAGILTEALGRGGPSTVTAFVPALDPVAGPPWLSPRAAYVHVPFCA